MGRSSGSRSSGRSSSSSFGRAPPRPAPAPAAAPVKQQERQASKAAAPVPQHHAPPAAAPQPAALPPAMAPQQQSGGGMFSGFASTIMQGVAFGTGSAIANRAVDAVVGPRTVVHEHKNEDAPAVAAASSAAPVAAPVSSSRSMSSRYCNDETNQFQQCLKDNNNDVSACQFYFDVLSQCQRNSK